MKRGGGGGGKFLGIKKKRLSRHRWSIEKNRSLWCGIIKNPAGDFGREVYVKINPAGRKLQVLLSLSHP